MGPRHDRDEMLEVAVAAALADGLDALTFGRLAKRLDIPDRTVVYYFPTKADLLTAVLARLGEQLMEGLGAAFGTEPLPADELLRRAWPVLTDDSGTPLFRIFFQLVGRAAAAEEPHATLGRELLGGWMAWLAELIVPGPGESAESAAAALIARLDGALLLHLVGPPGAGRLAVHGPEDPAP